jgi:hypothetical protein
MARLYHPLLFVRRGRSDRGSRSSLVAAAVIPTLSNPALAILIAALAAAAPAAVRRRRSAAGR